MFHRWELIEPTTNNLFYRWGLIEPTFYLIYENNLWQMNAHRFEDGDGYVDVVQSVLKG